MKINWTSDKIKEQFQSKDYLLRKYDQKLAEKLSLRMIELADVENYSKLPTNSFRHSIKKGKRFCHFAIDLPSIRTKRGKYRLVFVPDGEYDMANQSTITSIKILGIIDYH